MDNLASSARVNTQNTTKTVSTEARNNSIKMAAVSLLIPPSDFPASPKCFTTGPGYLPTPPSTSPPPSRNREKVIELKTMELPSFVTGSAESLMQARIADLALHGEDEGAFFVGDLGEVWKAWKSWVTELSRVELFYAVKCNPDPLVLQLLSLLGTGFDCASQSEMTTVLSLPSPPSPDKIIFANPCKPASFIRAARSLGVDAMTFDNTDELLKIAKLHPRAKLVLRILTDDSKSLCRLGLKFGAPIETCPSLLATAQSLGLDVVGVSFHVGSGCKDPQMFDDAVGRAKTVFEMGREKGYAFNFLDIGGGFEAEYFIPMARTLTAALDRHFPVEMGVRIIGEPGRFMVSSAFTLATNIIARRATAQAVLGGAAAGAVGATGLGTPESEKAEDKAMDFMSASIVSLNGSGEGSMHLGDAGSGEEQGPKVMYYINDGVYGSFNCIMFDHQLVHPFPLTLNGGTTLRPFPAAFPPNVQLEEDLTIQMGYGATCEPASVWGPTCDSIDCVRNVVMLPRELEVGDWLGWGEMGAYTVCAASTFNGFNKSSINYTTGADPIASAAILRLLGDAI